MKLPVQVAAILRYSPHQIPWTKGNETSAIFPSKLRDIDCPNFGRMCDAATEFCFNEKCLPLKPNAAIDHPFGGNYFAINFDNGKEFAVGGYVAAKKFLDPKHIKCK